MKPIPLATFQELGPAEELQQRLQKAGLPATINDESKLQRFWFMSSPDAAIHVEVPYARFAEAALVLAQLDRTEDALHAAIRCPECHSSRVEYPQLTRNFVTPTLARAFMALHVISPEYYCKECQYTWPRSVKTERALDVLGFPLDSKFWHPEGVPVEKRS